MKKFVVIVSIVVLVLILGVVSMMLLPKKNSENSLSVLSDKESDGYLFSDRDFKSAGVEELPTRSIQEIPNFVKVHIQAAKDSKNTGLIEIAYSKGSGTLAYDKMFSLSLSPSFPLISQNEFGDRSFRIRYPSNMTMLGIQKGDNFFYMLYKDELKTSADKLAQIGTSKI